MIRFTTRSIAMLLLSVALLGTTIAPALTKPGGNAAAAAACEGDEYLNYTDATGEVFKNAGQCRRYAAQHENTLTPVPTETPPTTSATLSFFEHSADGVNTGCYARLDVSGYEPDDYIVTFHPDETNHFFPMNVGESGTGTVTTFVEDGVSIDFEGYPHLVPAYVDGVPVATATSTC